MHSDLETAEELLDYSWSKGAITAFTRALAGQLADKGIRVNAIALGPHPNGGIPVRG